MTKMKRAVVFVFVLVIFYALWKLFSASVADIAWLAPGYTKLQLFLATSIAKFTVGLLQAFLLIVRIVYTSDIPVHPAHLNR